MRTILLVLLSAGLAIGQSSSIESQVHRWGTNTATWDRVIRNGWVVKSVSVEGLTARVSLAYKTPYKGKAAAFLEIINDRSWRVDVIPETFTLEATGAKPAQFEQADSREIAKSIDRWGRFAAGMARAGGELQQQQEHSTTTGSVYYGGQSGTYQSSTVKTKPDAQARQQAYKKASEIDRNTASRVNEVQSSALLANTLEPGTSIRGLVFYKYKGKPREVLLRLPLGDAVLEFPFVPLQATATTPPF